jgi:hypothetical protein
MGDISLRTLLDDVSWRDLRRFCMGERAVSEYVSDGGVSMSGENAFVGTAPGGSDGNAFSTGALPLAPPWACRGAALAFFLRRAMSDSWQLIQKMPCDVRAYLRFSIFLLQFLHLKQLAQKA